jgi:hypothetical protein
MHTNYVVVPTFVYKKISYRIEVWEYADDTARINVWSEFGDDFFFSALVNRDTMALDIFDIIDGIDRPDLEISDTPFAPE